MNLISFQLNVKIKNTQLTPVRLCSLPRNKGGNRAYECICDCGEVTIQPISAIVLGRVKSCGCYNHRKPQNKPFSYKRAKKAFLQKVVHLPDGCWQWLGCINDDGYGSVTYRSKQMGAHRASWLIHKGEIPIGMHVLHECDFPTCVNPKHLFLGTHTDNMRDSAAKGRLSGRWLKRKSI